MVFNQDKIIKILKKFENIPLTLPTPSVRYIQLEYIDNLNKVKY